MSRPANMRPGDFWGRCIHFSVITKEGCPGIEFTDFSTMKAHLTEHHPEKVTRAKAARNTGALAPVTTRKRPWGAPAVRLDRQRIAPGTTFTFKGYPCQVVGAASTSRTRFLAVMPCGTEPTDSPTARRVAGQSNEEAVMWEVTAPTALVRKAVQESA